MPGAVYLEQGLARTMIIPYPVHICSHMCPEICVSGGRCCGNTTPNKRPPSQPDWGRYLLSRNQFIAPHARALRAILALRVYSPHLLHTQKRKKRKAGRVGAASSAGKGGPERRAARASTQNRVAVRARCRDLCCMWRA